MEGTVQYEGSGDVLFAFYKGNEQLTEMPQKGEGLYYERADCTNDASVEWNNTKWAPLVVNIKESKTKCTLYFATIEQIVCNQYGTESLFCKSAVRGELAYDDTEENNLRYIGASPYNYIDIGDRETNGNKILWRIIGVMNNMTVINDDKTESTGQSLVKIIRADRIGLYSWDSSASGVNSGYGVNEWSKADLMTTLNTGAYWSKESGECYNNYNDVKTTCDFSSIGLTKEVRNKLAKVRWNTGTMPDAYSSNTIKITASYMYQGERSDNHGKKFCSSGNYCNDQVNRTTTWDGYIGLMYPSDYGYAVGGSERTECLANTMDNWFGSTPDCKGNDWLRDSSNYQWTITPVPDSWDANSVFLVDSGGSTANLRASNAHAVRPTAYLDSNIKIQEKSDSDYGSQSNPFVLEGVS